MLDVGRRAGAADAEASCRRVMEEGEPAAGAPLRRPYDKGLAISDRNPRQAQLYASAYNQSFRAALRRCRTEHAAKPPGSPPTATPPRNAEELASERAERARLQERLRELDELLNQR